MPRIMVFPSRPTASAEAAGTAAEARGLTTVQRAAPASGIACLEAPLTWLADLPYDAVGRTITVIPIRDALALRYPVFVKAPDDRTLRAMVCADGIYLSDADAAFDVILRAAAPAGELSPRDKAFVRPVPARAILTEGGVR